MFGTSDNNNDTPWLPPGHSPTTTTHQPGVSFDGVAFMRDQSMPAQDADGLRAECQALRAELERTRAQLRQVQTLSRIGTWSSDLLTGLAEWSAETYRITGLATDAFDGTTACYFALIHPDDRHRVEQARKLALEAGQPYRMEYRIVRPDGSIRRIRVRGEVERDDAGQPVRLYGSMEDVTELYDAHQELLRTERLLQTAGRIAHFGGWQLDVGSSRVYWSDQVCAMHGVGFGTAPSLEEMLTFYAPEWRARIRDRIDGCIQGGVGFDEEMEIITAGGDRVWVRNIAEPVTDENGDITSVQGALQDISDSKRSALEVRRLASSLTTTLDSITDGFYTLDREWRFTYLNREAERLLERGRDELYRRVIWDAIDGMSDTRLAAEFERALRDDCTVDFEEYDRGQGRWYEFHAYPSGQGLAVYFRDITRRREVEQDIHLLAYYDPLTWLPNRRLLMDRMEQAIAASIRTGEFGAVAYFDLDDFKTLNDSLGHDKGDLLLRQVGKRLSNHTAKSGFTVGRHGGDEFMVVLENLGTSEAGAREQAIRLATEMQDLVARPYELDRHVRTITPSVGVSLFGSTETTVTDVLQRVDIALYGAKDEGRGGLRVFDAGLQHAVDQRAELEVAIRRGLESGEFVLFYQPQVNADGDIVGAEGLCRWHHPAKGLVYPDTFIPLAEESGLIIQLGRVVLRQACERLAEWARTAELRDLKIAVNVSSRQFHHPDFVDDLLAVLEETGAEPHRLQLELTEGLLLKDVEDIITKMERLRQRGVSFSLDDFGTGYSSLFYLKRLPLDTLKIDKSFVHDMLRNPNDAAIVRTSILLANSLGLEIVAEGVETDEERAFLLEQGCPGFQGFLFGKAVPAEQFEAERGANPAS